MSTLIMYSTKYGCTEKCAKMLAEKITGQVELANLKTVSNLDLARYEKVIIGGSIYIGKIRPEVTRFCTEHLNELKVKRLGLFVCGIRNGEAAEAELKSAFPAELLSVAVAKEFFGGELVYNKMGFMDRQITKMVAKSGDESFPALDAGRNASVLDVAKIDKFAQIIKAV